MKKYYKRDIEQLNYFLTVVARYLVGMGGKPEGPLVNIEQQPISQVSGWVWNKIGFNLTIGVLMAFLYLMAFGWLLTKLLSFFGI